MSDTVADVDRGSRTLRATAGVISRYRDWLPLADADRTLAAFLRIPRPLYDLVFGREWFVDPAARPGDPVRRDVFDGLP